MANKRTYDKTTRRIEVREKGDQMTTDEVVKEEESKTTKVVGGSTVEHPQPQQQKITRNPNKEDNYANYDKVWFLFLQLFTFGLVSFSFFYVIFVLTRSLI